MSWGEQVLEDEGGRWSSGEIVWNIGGPHGVHRPVVFWKEVVKLRWWHACTWLQNITSKQCSHWVGVYRQQTYLMLLLDVRSPRRWARPGVQGRWEHILSTLYAACAYLVGWNGLSVFTLDDKVLPFGSSFIELCMSPYSITTYWRTYRFQLTLSPLLRSPAVELTLNGIHSNFPQSYTTSSSPLIRAIQIQNKTQEPGVTGFHASFFIIKNTTWLDRDLLHFPVLTMATPTGEYSSQLEIIEYLSR